MHHSSDIAAYCKVMFLPGYQQRPVNVPEFTGGTLSGSRCWWMPSEQDLQEYCGSASRVNLYEGPIRCLGTADRVFDALARVFWGGAPRMLLSFIGEDGARTCGACLISDCGNSG